MFKKLFRRIERFSWGGEVVAVHKIRKDIIVRELKNPHGIDLSVGNDSRDSSHLTMAETAQLVRILIEIKKKSEDGETL